MLNKGAILETPKRLEEEFISNLFFIEKGDGRIRPVINLKHLNQFTPYQHFKMKGWHCLRNILKKRDYICKLDLKKAYFSVPLNSDPENLFGFFGQRNFTGFFNCFVLDPAPRIVSKLL